MHLLTLLNHWAVTQVGHFFNTICAEKIDQKEVLTLGEEVMREEIRNSLRFARFFSILLQDRVSIEGKDQIPVFIRSVTGEGFPQKYLMGFLPCDVDSDTLFLMLNLRSGTSGACVWSTAAVSPTCHQVPCVRN